MRDCNRKKERAGSLRPEDRPPPCSLKREADDESRSTIARIHIDRAAMVFNYLSGNVETKASAALTFGGEKRLKDMRYIRGGDSAAGIRNRNANESPINPSRNRKNAFGLIGHCVHCILQQVDQGLEHLPFV